MNRHTVVALAALILLVLIAVRSSHLETIGNVGGIRAALVYTPQDIGSGDAIRAAYSESLREAGIRFDWIASTDVSLLGAAALHRMYDAIIFPDGIDVRVPEDATQELTRYAQLGGLVTIIADAGSAGRRIVSPRLALRGRERGQQHVVRHVADSGVR